LTKRGTVLRNTRSPTKEKKGKLGEIKERGELKRRKKREPIIIDEWKDRGKRIRIFGLAKQEQKEEGVPRVRYWRSSNQKKRGNITTSVNLLRKSKDDF